MHAALRRSQRLHTTRLTSKTHLRIKFSIKNLMHLWQHLDFEFLSKTILRDFDKKRSDLITLKSVERESHTDDMMKSFKKKFLKQTNKRQRITKVEDEAKEKFDQKRRKRSLLLSWELIYVSSSSFSRLIFAFIIYDLQHFSFMKDDRFRWISERITQRTRSEFWVDRTNRLHDQ